MVWAWCKCGRARSLRTWKLAFGSQVALVLFFFFRRFKILERIFIILSGIFVEKFEKPLRIQLNDICKMPGCGRNGETHRCEHSIKPSWLESSTINLGWLLATTVATQRKHDLRLLWNWPGWWLNHPVQKYERQIGSFPQVTRGENSKKLFEKRHHPVTFEKTSPKSRPPFALH